MRGGAVAPPDARRWRARLVAWRKLEREYAGRVGLRFIVGCPKTASDARALVSFIDGDNDGDDDDADERGDAPAATGAAATAVRRRQRPRDAIAGVGQWGRERPATERGDAYAVCAAAGLARVCVHAGENVLQSAQDDGCVFDAAAAARYASPPPLPLPLTQRHCLPISSSPTRARGLRGALIDQH